MAPKNPARVRAFPVALALALFILVTTGALSIVWMRQQISRSAGNGIKYEKAIVALDRKTNALRSKIAQLQSPVSLKERLGKAFAQSKKPQIVWIDEQYMNAGNFRDPVVIDERWMLAFNSGYNMNNLIVDGRW